MTTTPVGSPFSRSRMPLYAQLASVLRQRLKSGEWAAGEKLPTLEVLEAEYSVARVTARQAVALLEEEGLVRRKQGRGTFVTEAAKDHARLPLATGWDNLLQLIDGTTMKLVSVDEVDRPPRLKLEDGRPVSGYQHIQRVHSKDDAAYCVIDLYIGRELYARAPTEFQTQLALRVLSEVLKVPIESAHQTLTIGSADLATATFLEIEVGAPTAEVRRVITDVSGSVIYFAEITYRGDFVKFDIDLLSNRAGTKSTGV